MEFLNALEMEQLKNETEQIVVDELNLHLNKLEEGSFCSCRDCMLDMLCYALNNLPPKYRVSLLGTLYTQADEELKELAKTKVAEAIDVITKNPSHSL